MAFCPPLPENHPRIRVSDEADAAKSHSIVFSTACWRQYIGTWKIQKSKFYLVGVEGRYQMTGSEPILADWFSGTIRIPQGEQLLYVHMGFGSVYERELLIAVKSGVVLGMELVDNRGKGHDHASLGEQNLPGGENSFVGDDLQNRMTDEFEAKSGRENDDPKEAK